VVDRSEGALELAKKCGADQVVLADGTQVKRVSEITGGAGCEAVIDFVGEGGAIEDGIAMLRRAGTYYVIGYGGVLKVPTIDIISQEINFLGNLVGTYNDLAELMTLTAEGRVTLETRVYPLDAVNDAMDDLDHGRLHGRGIFVPSAAR
jgi:NAD+-dependent secondary alcohol dehydrogenase Adh1